MKILLLGIAGLLVLVAIAVGAMMVGEARTEERARAFCDRFRPGTPFDAVRRAAEQEVERPHRTVREQDVTVSFQGAMPLSLHLCTIKAVDGKVSEASYSHVD